MTDAEGDWAARVETLLGEARELQAFFRHEQSLVPVSDARRQLEMHGRQAARPDLLAEALRLQVNATCRQGTPETLAAGDRDMAEAFRLADGLRGSQLATAPLLGRLWRIQGTLHFYYGSSDDRLLAAAACEKAIEIQQTLDLTRPEFRNDLALSWNNKGLALQAIGGPESLAAAVSAYDVAIELQQALDLTRPEFRNDLAGSWGNKGNALQAIGGPESLAAAVSAYDVAIELGQALDLTRPEFRNDLARSWTKKGEASLAISGPGSLAGSVECLQHAHRLRKPLLVFPHPFYLAAVRDSGPTLGNLARSLRSLEGPSAATDSLDDALMLTRQLEQVGFRDQRLIREILFQNALECYRFAGQAGFLPELVREHLDPAEPGSACDSADIHQAAAGALAAAVRDGAAGQPATLGRLLQAQRWLEGVRFRHLAGSAALAGINADLEQAAGRPAEALRILDRQVAYRAKDPQGYWLRARFRMRQGRGREAAPDLLMAGRLALGVADPARDGAVIGQVGAALLRLRLDDIAQDTAFPGFSGRGALLTRLDQLKDWLLIDLPRNLLDGMGEEERERREAWRPLLPELFNQHWQEAAALRDALLRQRDRQEAEAARKAARAGLEQSLEVARSALHALPQVWGDFADELLTAFAQASNAFAGQAPEAAEAAMLETMQAAVKRVMERLGDAELKHETAVLAEKLGPIWTLLLPVERRYLACALRCRADVAMWRFVPLELGCAVELALLARLLEPVRTAHREHGLALPQPPQPERHALRVKARAYLGGGKHLTLGELIGSFRDLTALLAAPDHTDLFGFLAAWLAGQPGFEASGAASAAWDRRHGWLDELNQARKKVAHSSATPLTAEEVDALWAQTMDDLEDAFFRYFPALFSRGASGPGSHAA